MSLDNTSQDVTNVTDEDIVSGVDPLIDVKDFVFRFKKDKLDNKRANVTLKGAIPSVEGVKAIIRKGGKEWELLQDALYDTVRGVIGGIVSEKDPIDQESFPWADVTWEKIANMSREDRRSSAIAPEVWEAFAKDYLEVMPALTGKTKDFINNAILVYLTKMTMIKSDKKSLAKLKDQLALYMDTKNAEQFLPILELLTRRTETYLAADDVAMIVANL